MARSLNQFEYLALVSVVNKYNYWSTKFGFEQDISQLSVEFPSKDDSKISLVSANQLTYANRMKL